MKREQQATILVVEDSKNIQDVLMNIFQIVGHCVEIAGDGYEALALLTARPRPFDLVLLDLSMPVMDGIACVKDPQAPCVQAPDAYHCLHRQC